MKTMQEANIPPESKPTHLHAAKGTQAARSAIPDEQTVIDMTDLFKVFGDPTRARILLALSKGELQVCCIAEVLDMTQSAISHQLRILKQARLVRSRREGREMYYALDDDHIMTILGQGLAHVGEMTR